MRRSSWGLSTPVIEGTAWKNHAACGPDTAPLFFGTEHRSEALFICSGCPVQEWCEADTRAAKEEHRRNITAATSPPRACGGTTSVSRSIRRGTGATCPCGKGRRCWTSPVASAVTGSRRRTRTASTAAMSVGAWLTARLNGRRYRRAGRADRGGRR